MHTKNPYGFKSHGVRNFYFIQEPGSLLGVLFYLSRTNVSSISSIEEAEKFIRSFCKHELGFDNSSLIRCARRIEKNWPLFKQAVAENK